MSTAVIAVDVGGTTIKGVVVDQDGTFIHELSRTTPAERGPDAVVAELQAVIAELREREPGSAVGVVVPGAVDPANGIAQFSANLGFRNLPLRDLVSNATGLPALLDHDVRAAGMAERTVGLTAGMSDYLLAVIGTGIAGVIDSDGHSIRGAGGIAGELGHVPVWPDGDPCPCGQRGCLERYASAASISRRYAELSGHRISAGEVVGRLRSDEVAARVWQDAITALAIAFATCTMLFDPAMIVLGGGLSEAGEALLAPVQAALAERVIWRSPPPVRVSQLGGRAGRVGAAVMAWRMLGLEDFSAWRTRA